MDLGISGLASGFDWRSLVDQLADVERAPETRLRNEQSVLQQRNNALGSIKTQLSVLQSRVNVLKDPAFFNTRGVAVSNASAATATASAGTPLGSYKFAITQMASSAVLKGAANAGKPLAESGDVSALKLSDAAFATAVTAGTFTVNGKQVTIAATDTLAAVFTKISDATGAKVTGKYNSDTDKIELTGATEIVLGSATDTSNFLQAAKLANNGGKVVSSSASLGAIKSTAVLNSANFTTAISDGGSGAGEFKINGVSIKFNAGSDSLSNVIDRINSSGAGVTASYDSSSDGLVLTNRATGDVGFSVEDVTGNFAAATGLASGTLQRGKNLLYTVNGGSTLSSTSNTITEASSGIVGLNVSVLAEQSFSIDVSVDAKKIKSAVDDFVAEYNKTQALINTNTASTTDSKGKVTAGLLAGDSDAAALNSTLRRMMSGDVGGLSGLVRRMEALGYTSNGNDDALGTTDSTKLEGAIANNLVDLKDFFTHDSTGLAVSFAKYLDNTIGENGSLVKRQENLTKQSSNIDSQVSDIEKTVLSNRQRLIESFTAMETAQQKINSQLAYLTKTFG